MAVALISVCAEIAPKKYSAGCEVSKIRLEFGSATKITAAALQK